MKIALVSVKLNIKLFFTGYWCDSKWLYDNFDNFTITLQHALKALKGQKSSDSVTHFTGSRWAKVL